MRCTHVAATVAALALAGCGSAPDAPASPTPTLDAPLHHGPVEARPITAAQPKAVARQARERGSLSVVHQPFYPTRVAATPDGRLAVSDPKIGSVFLHALPSLEVVGELKRLQRPLGVAVDAAGRIYVGVDGLNRVEVFGPLGNPLRVIGDGQISMPNDLAVAPDGRLFVADSLADEVKVFGPDGALLASVGGEGSPQGRLSFPAAVALSSEALFVADQGSHQVHVFELGTWRWLRSLGQPAEAFSEVWEGRFVKPQALAIDAAGRLHVLDATTGLVQLLSTSDGGFLGRYAEPATALRTPMALALLPDGQAAVTTAGDRRLTLVLAAAEGN